MQQVLDAAGCTAAVHARDIDSDQQVGLDADADVQLASVFKVGVLLELMRRAYDDGDLDLLERIVVPAGSATLGPTGLSICVDDVEMSLRDLALSMMYVSDNTATDVVAAIVGLDRVQKTLDALGLEHTYVRQDCRDLLDKLARDVGLESLAQTSEPETARRIAADPFAHARAMAQADAIAVRDTNQSTPREVTRLLQLIWRDEAASPAACAHVRAIMGKQLFGHRLRTGFPDTVATAAKTGTLPFLKNEAGVVTYPDGRRYAVAVFTRSRSMVGNQPDQDRVIGTVARLAVDHLRELDGLPTDVAMEISL